MLKVAIENMQKRVTYFRVKLIVLCSKMSTNNVKIVAKVSGFSKSAYLIIFDFSYISCIILCDKKI